MTGPNDDEEQGKLQHPQRREDERRCPVTSVVHTTATGSPSSANALTDDLLTHPLDR
jgi:hypothetical protein